MEPLTDQSWVRTARRLRSPSDQTVALCGDAVTAVYVDTLLGGWDFATIDSASTEPAGTFARRFGPPFDDACRARLYAGVWDVILFGLPMPPRAIDYARWVAHIASLDRPSEQWAFVQEMGASRSLAKALSHRWPDAARAADRPIAQLGFLTVREALLPKCEGYTMLLAYLMRSQRGVAPWGVYLPGGYHRCFNAELPARIEAVALY